MDNVFAVGEIVYIVPAWCDRPSEAEMPYAVVEDRDSRLLITTLDSYWDDRAIRPQSAVSKFMVRRAS